MPSIDPFKGFLIGAVLIAAVAVGIGGYQVYLIATGGPDFPDSADEALGELACEDPTLTELEAPLPGIAESAYDRDATYIEEVQHEPLAGQDGLRILITFDRPELTEAAASRVDRSSPNVTIENTTVIIEDTEREPFRLWVDAVTEEQEPVRHEMELCPGNVSQS